MSVFSIGVLAFAAFIVGRVGRGRELTLLAASVFFIYWLQPAQTISSLSFWLPTGTLALSIFCWVLVAPPEVRAWGKTWPAVLVIVGTILLVDLSQFLGSKIFSATPRLWIVVLALAAFFALTFFTEKLPRRPILFSAVLWEIVLLFVFLKTPYFLNSFLNSIFTPSEEGVLFSWLGFSYVAFRLLHTLRDRQTERLPALTLAEYLNYVIFFPSFAAGPIDRAERFVLELRNPVALAEQDWVQAGTRFFIGLFKKFVIADALALVSFNDALAEQVRSPVWIWFLLYAYSLRIYFDFSGYTDIAIGLARILGIRLPENFAAPFLKPNLTQFWNSWHMTLTHWFRAYFFNPITRSLRTKQLPVPLIIFTAQLSTMVVIGLWHGINWSFFFWGIWHGLGLFIQNRWSEWIQTRMETPPPPHRQLVLNVIGMFLTFNFVSLGWLFFTLSSPLLALQVLMKLFGAIV
ncbi:MAG TPA: MBOAT family O-acyltransferase [Anaerolineales bacterium]|nr:MBOAT family O-acyltransferase [Anaerolineales bacterium]